MEGDMSIRPATPEEWKYAYTPSSQIQEQTGCIGHLRGDFGSMGNSFYTTWTDHMEKWKTDVFKKELDQVINYLRSDECGLLAGKKGMAGYATIFPDCMFFGDYCTQYGFRVDTNKYVFLLRCNPMKGDYNFYCYCYESQRLDRHIERAKEGILFVDAQQREKFRIPDGGKIVITTAWREKSENTCCYIDDCHFGMGIGMDEKVFHINQFAEQMQKNGATYEPKSEEMQIQKAQDQKHKER